MHFPSPGLHPPEPRLVHIPDRRVCTCGRVLSHRERPQGRCSVCQALADLPNVHLLIPFTPSVA